MKLKMRHSQIPPIVFRKINATLCLKVVFFVPEEKRKPFEVWTTRRKKKNKKDYYFGVNHLLHSGIPDTQPADNSIFHRAAAFTNEVQGHLDNISTYIIMSSQCCARHG